MRAGEKEFFIKKIDEYYHEGKENNNIVPIEIVTEIILNRLILAFTSIYQHRLIGIRVNYYDNVAIDEIDEEVYRYLMNSNQERLHRWLSIIQVLESTSDLNDENFSNIKARFESWYYQIGGKFIKFYYRDDYLLHEKQVLSKLNISRKILKNYIKLGLEYTVIDNRLRFPKHTVRLWNDYQYRNKANKVTEMRESVSTNIADTYIQVIDKKIALKKKYHKNKLEEAFDPKEIKELCHLVSNEEVLSDKQKETFDDYFAWKKYRAIKLEWFGQVLKG